MATLTFSACKKKRKSIDVTQASIDSRNVQAEIDAFAINEVSYCIETQRSLVYRGSGTLGTHGVTGSGYYPIVDTTNLKSGSILLNYDETGTYGDRKRTGSIKVTVENYATGQRWSQKGCVLKVDYLNYQITSPSNGKSILLNGSQQFTNVSGGSWTESMTLKSTVLISLNITGSDLSATFEDGKTASYNINKKLTCTAIHYTKKDILIWCRVEAIGSLNGIYNLENYGLTRDGVEFTSQVSIPVLMNLNCGGPWAPVAGEVNIKVDNKEFESKCLFGVDKSGKALELSEYFCPYGWKIVSKDKETTVTRVIPYK
jgi:hypothetical protein